MKKWIALTLSFILTLGLCACSDNGDVPGGEEKGNQVTAQLLTQVLATEGDDSMKVILEYDEDYNIIGAKTYLDDKLYMEVTYAKNMDKPLVQQEYDEDGKKDSRVEYTYDEKGRELTTFYYDEEGNRRRGLEYTYDASGNKLTEKSYDGEDVEYETAYTYDADGNKLTETGKDPDGRINSNVYTYVDGKLVREDFSNNEGHESWVTYTYDDKGNLLTKVSGQGEADNPFVINYTYENTYNGEKLMEVKEYCDSELIRHTKYDADGNEIFDASYWDGQESYRTETFYENGVCTGYASYSDGELTGEMHRTFNENGDILEQINRYSEGEERKQVYSYNDSGLMTGFKSYYNGELSSEYTLSYKDVTVSEDVAEKIEKFNKLAADL